MQEYQVENKKKLKNNQMGISATSILFPHILWFIIFDLMLTALAIYRFKRPVLICNSRMQDQFGVFTFFALIRISKMHFMVNDDTV